MSHVGNVQRVRVDANVSQRPRNAGRVRRSTPEIREQPPAAFVVASVPLFTARVGAACLPFRSAYAMPAYATLRMVPQKSVAWRMSARNVTQKHSRRRPGVAGVLANDVVVSEARRAATASQPRVREIAGTGTPATRYGRMWLQPGEGASLQCCVIAIGPSAVFVHRSASSRPVRGGSRGTTVEGGNSAVRASPRRSRAARASSRPQRQRRQCGLEVVVS